MFGIQTDNAHTHTVNVENALSYFESLAVLAAYSCRYPTVGRHVSRHARHGQSPLPPR